MAHLGGVSRRNDMFFAKVDTQDSGVRYWMEGPLRKDQQEACQDLDYIRSAAGGDATWAQGLHSMKLAAKELREEVKAEAKASTRGAIKKEGATGYTARLRYIENGKARAMLGPARQSERRAQIDLDKLRALPLIATNSN
jgi:hypothetical protein